MSEANISEEIMEAAKARGLDWTGTGGGCDYISRDLKPGSAPVMILGTPGDAGSPDKLDEEAFVAIYFEESWCENYLVFNFDTANTALDFMTSFKSADLAGFQTEEKRLCEAIQKQAQSTKAASYEYPGYVETGKWAWGYEGNRLLGNTTGERPDTVEFYRTSIELDAQQILLWLSKRG